MKIVFWDVENFPMLVTSWGLWEPRLSHENIVQDTSLICVSWKELGEEKVHSVQIDPLKPRDDKAVILAARNALAEADVIVGHNGDKFDLKVLNARIVYHGIEPLPPLKTIDTLKVARKHFKFTSNRLDYLGEFLGVGRKIHTDFKLWLKILFEKDKKALKEMVSYNKQDVILLEKVYKRLRPYMNNHPNHRLMNGNVCPICNKSGALQSRGVRLNKTTTVPRYQCQKCRGWSSGKNIS